jgi:hypothetical protein
VEYVVWNVETYHRQFCPLYRYGGILQDNRWHLGHGVIGKETISATNSLSTNAVKFCWPAGLSLFRRRPEISVFGGLT